MRKFIIYILILIIMPVCMIQMISAYSEEVKPVDIYGPLIKQRIDIWNNIYGGDYEYDKFAVKMSDIEAASLLEEDLEAFKDIQESPIDMEKVKLINMEQKSFRKIKNGYEAKLLMNWQIEGLEGEYEESSLITIEVIKVKDRWCLSKWEDNEL